MSSGDEQYVRTEAIPAWMATLAKQIIPAAVLGALASGIVTWHIATTNASAISDLKEELHAFTRSGGRFTSEQGAIHQKRIENLERWQRTHTEWGREKTGYWDALHQQHERRLSTIERKIDRLNRP